MLRKRNLRPLLQKRTSLEKYLIKLRPLLKGSLILRSQACGKPNCSCHKEGRKHNNWYLCASLENKYRQIYIPTKSYIKAKTWSQNYQRAQRIIDKLTLINVKILRTKEKS